MYPPVDNQRLYFLNFDILIALFLHGAFSYFSTTKPSPTTLEGTYEIYPMNPEDRWNQDQIQKLRVKKS